MDNKSLVFEKIYNNFLENIYLHVFAIVKNKNATLKIIINSFDKVLLFEYNIDNLRNLSNKIKRYIILQTKLYINNHKEEINNVYLDDIDYKIPKELYLLNFNIHSIFNEIDNQIFSAVFVYKIDLRDVVHTLHLDSLLIVERYSVLIRHIRLSYTNRIRKQLVEIINS